jgi:hypothetical protein
MRPAFARSAGHQAQACIARCAFNHDAEATRRGRIRQAQDSIAARDPKVLSPPVAAGCSIDDADRVRPGVPP